MEEPFRVVYEVLQLNCASTAGLYLSPRLLLLLAKTPRLLQVPMFLAESTYWNLRRMVPITAEYVKKRN